MNKTKWSDTIERYLREGRTVSGGCGPSGAMKAINASVQQFATQAKAEASSVFDASSTVFNNIMKSTQQIVAGGPSQMGYSQAELSALNSQAIEAGATMARNLKGAAASASAAIGGGNTVTPAGGTQASIQAGDIAAATQTAQTENQILESGYETGRQNYEAAIGQEEKAPDVFNASTAANEGVVKAQTNAEQSQQNIDTQSNWAMNDIMKLGTAAVGSWASGGFKLPGGSKSGGTPSV